MELQKREYEISLWKDVLQQIELGLVACEKDLLNYEPGKFFVESTSIHGADQYVISYDEYNENIDYYKQATDNEVATVYTPFSYYDEEKKFVLGSSGEKSPYHCFNPKLNQKINGEITLTFSLYLQWFDTQTGEWIDNPYIKYLNNEEKIKLNFEGKWYDFVIKDIQEDSSTKVIQYTCKDRFIAELSRSGFDIEFDRDLGNNIGTIQSLANAVVEGSDWEAYTDGNFIQYNEEPLYEIKLTSPILYYDVAGYVGQTLETDTLIYVFYSDITGQKSSLQFLFDVKPDGNKIVNPEWHNYGSAPVSSYTEDGKIIFYSPTESGETPEGQSFKLTHLRGPKMVAQPQSTYDPGIDKYVSVYQKTSDTEPRPKYYGFQELKTFSSEFVENYIVNPSTFTSTVGWQSTVPNGTEFTRQTLDLHVDPPLSAGNIINDTVFTTYLKIPNAREVSLLNSCFRTYASSIGGLNVGDKFVVRLKYKVWHNEKGLISDSFELDDREVRSAFTPIVKIFSYNRDGDVCKPVNKETIFELQKYQEKKPINGELEEESKSFVYLKGVVSKEQKASQSSLADSINPFGFFLEFTKNVINDADGWSDADIENFNAISDVYIENIEFFRRIEYGDKLCVPGGPIFQEQKTVYTYYPANHNWQSIEELIPTDRVEDKPHRDYVQSYYQEGKDSFMKRASITAKESNRFNLIQKLCEKFECWAKIDITHETDGRISLDADNLFRQRKSIQFVEKIGTDKSYGFRYGLNLKSIQRQVDSEKFTTKLIVKDNANEFADGGFCSIARSSENTSKENFIYDFDYYYRLGALNLGEVTNDLYININGYLGYYTKLRKINKDREELIEQLSNTTLELIKLKAQHQVYSAGKTSAQETRQEKEDTLYRLLVPPENRSEIKTFAEALEQFTDPAYSEQLKAIENNPDYISNIAAWAQSKNAEKKYQELLEGVEGKEGAEGKEGVEDKIKTLEKIQSELEAKIERRAKAKRSLNLVFYKKYSRFIQEGYWISEDYTDDNLYYLDSISTLHNSAQPKITYKIDLLDLCALEEYKHYKFSLGDITYVEDPEFFGWVGNVPYREQVVVTEIQTDLDNPEKTVIKVKNYKDQFEDLFSRITAQTQQAEFHTGEYERAANAIAPDGSITFTALSDALKNNQFILQSAIDQSVLIDESGITTASTSNLEEMVRIVSGGIFLSRDGGKTWRTGITSSGINASALTTGLLNTEKIIIAAGSEQAFLWNAQGISAYGLGGYGYNLNNYVRFNQHGLYGVEDASAQIINNINDVMNYASFALTWKGFSFRSEDGSVRISSENDFQVLKDTQERIKIGRLGERKFLEFSGTEFKINEFYYERKNDKYIKTSDETPDPEKQYYTEQTQYGIRISNSTGESVMETDESGRLWLHDELNIGINQTDIKIGYLKEKRKNANNIEKHEIIRVGGGKENKDYEFVVYEDGYMVASGGKIGSIEISQIENAALSVWIESSKGNIIGDSEEILLTAHLLKGGSKYEPDDKTLSYKWFEISMDEKGEISRVDIEGESNKTLTIASEFGDQYYLQYGCEITIN